MDTNAADDLLAANYRRTALSGAQHRPGIARGASPGPRAPGRDALIQSKADVMGRIGNQNSEWYKQSETIQKY
jgi:hypothetical protein